MRPRPFDGRTDVTPWETREQADSFLERHFPGQTGFNRGRKEIHPKSGWPIEVGEHRRFSSPEHGEGPLEWRIDDHGETPTSKFFPDKDIRREPISHVYRAVSHEEWEQAKQRGHLKSDQRGTIADWEGTNAGIDPETARSYLPQNGKGRILKIRVHPEDNWFATSHDDYARTREEIPLDRVEHVTPLIHRVNGDSAEAPDDEDTGPRKQAVRKTADDDDYRMQHRPPDAEDGTPAHDLTHNMPDDVYTHPHYYDTGGGTEGNAFQESMSQLHRVRGKPEGKVRIYRALPAEHSHQGFRPGDWVSLSKSYARQHGIHNEDSDRDWPVISTVVPAKHLHTACDDLNEFGYNGPHRETAGVAFKGGRHQEVRQHADGVVRKVKRRPAKPSNPLRDYSISYSRFGDNHHVDVYDHKENYAGHAIFRSDGSTKELNVNEEHAHLPVEDQMRATFQKHLGARQTTNFRRWRALVQTSTGYDEQERELEGPLYHGGRAKVGPGDHITKGRRTNSWGDEGDKSTHNYFTTDLDTARSYAEAVGPQGRVYEVEPTGPIKKDYGSSDYKSEHPLQVTREVPRHEWQGRQAARKTASWTFEHHDLGEGGHRILAIDPADKPVGMLEYKVKYGDLHPGTPSGREPGVGDALHAEMLRRHPGHLPVWPGEPKPPEPEPEPTAWYHGTTVPNVRRVLPASQHKRHVTFPHDTDRDHAYATSDEDNAWDYAEKAWHAGDGHSGPPRVYQVHPRGTYEKDPQYDGDRHRGNHETDYRSKDGWDVVREIKMPKNMGKPGDWR